MAWIKTLAREVFGLFVDDGRYAFSILIWVGVVWLALPHVGLPPGWDAVLLFVGLATILLTSAMLRARR